MNRWLRRMAILGGIALVILLLRVTVFRPSPVPVTTFAVERGSVEETVVNSRAGTVESRNRSRMSPAISGLVVEIPVEKGQTVAAATSPARSPTWPFMIATDPDLQAFEPSCAS